MGKTWLSVPKDWIASFGDIARFSARVVADVFNGRVLHFVGETLRQAGILILGSAIVIWGLAVPGSIDGLARSGPSTVQPRSHP